MAHDHATDEGRGTWPVFIVGCHRSGTTLVRYLLDAHPHLACPPESKFIAGLEAFFRYPQVLYALRTFGVQHDTIMDSFRQLVDRVMRDYAERRGKARWVDKTPNYYRLLPFIDTMFRQRVLYLYIVRHPLDTIDSLQRTVRREQPTDPELASALTRYGLGRDAWARYWDEVNQLIGAFIAGRERRVKAFKYEDLIADPERVCRDCLAFLHEPWCEHLIDEAFRVSHTPGYQDWTMGTHTGVDRHSVDRWTAWPDDEIAKVWILVRDTAVRWGYSVERPSVEWSAEGVPQLG